MTVKDYLYALAVGVVVALAVYAAAAEAAHGAEIDARKARVLLTVLHDASGQLDGTRLHAGRFIFRQAS